MTDDDPRRLDKIELFVGATSGAESHVYARLPSDSPAAGLRLSGRVVGPHCRYARTLKATIPLVDQGEQPALLARALVLDPCFWSPREPYLYHAEIELHDRDALVARAEHPLGIRWLGVGGQQLIWEGKNWILRAAEGPAAAQEPLDAWHESATAVVVDDPDDAFCREAAEVGVLLVARLAGDADRLTASLRRLGRWPSVGLAIVDAVGDLPSDLERVAPNLLLIEPHSPGELPAPWAHLALVDAGDPDALAQAASTRSLPLIAWRPAGEANAAAARAACDRLQRDLAGKVDLVGFLV